MTFHRPGDGERTQGEVKMIRYIADLIRNRYFKQLLKRMRKGRTDSPSGMYRDWTPKEREASDRINNELLEIINGYETLRKRCKKLFKGDRVRDVIAESYFLDNGLMNLADALSRNENGDSLDWVMMYAEPDMCKVVDLHDQLLSPFNKGEENIYLNRVNLLRTKAYPVAISINPKASKRDVLDFIEKRWDWIENNHLRAYANKKLRQKPRKHRQEIIDYIWAHRYLTSEQIRVKLDVDHPGHKLVYYEINKLIQLEKKRRLEEL